MKNPWSLTYFKIFLNTYCWFLQSFPLTTVTKIPDLHLGRVKVWSASRQYLQGVLAGLMPRHLCSPRQHTGINTVQCPWSKPPTVKQQNADSSALPCVSLTPKLTQVPPLPASCLPALLLLPCPRLEALPPPSCTPQAHPAAGCVPHHPHPTSPAASFSPRHSSTSLARESHPSCAAFHHTPRLCFPSGLCPSPFGEPISTISEPQPSQHRSSAVWVISSWAPSSCGAQDTHYRKICLGCLSWPQDGEPRHGDTALPITGAAGRRPEERECLGTVLRKWKAPPNKVLPSSEM